MLFNLSKHKQIFFQICVMVFEKSISSLFLQYDNMLVKEPSYSFVPPSEISNIFFKSYLSLDLYQTTQKYRKHMMTIEYPHERIFLKFTKLIYIKKENMKNACPHQVYTVRTPGITK